MGGDATPNAEPMSSVLQAYTNYLPGLVSATSAQQPNVAQNQLNATLATQPLYNALNLHQAQQYSVPLAQVGQDVQRSNALAGGETNLASIMGAGGRSALAATDLARAANPNYTKVQDAASNQATNLLGSINLNGLSPGEQNSVERSLNQSNFATGNMGLDNATNAVKNAMNFGGAFNNKLGILGNALGAANQTATSAQNTGVNPVNIALGQPNVATGSNFGTGTFTNTNAGTQQGSSNNAFGLGSSVLGNMTSMNNANTGAQASQNNANSIPSYMQAAGSMMPSCCFIMLEAYHGQMPDHVRKCRDRYYRTVPRIAKGYIRMAHWLVPLMRRYDFVRQLVWDMMVNPLTQYGLFVTRKDTTKGHFRWARKFWFTVWNLTGY